MISDKQRGGRPKKEPSNPVAGRLEYVRQSEGFSTLKAFWEALGGKLGTGATYEAIRTWHTDREPPVSYLNRVWLVFQSWNPAWLLTGIGPRKDQESAIRQALKEKPLSERHSDALGIGAELTVAEVPSYLHDSIAFLVYDVCERWSDLRPKDQAGVRGLLHQLLPQTMGMRAAPSEAAAWRQQTRHHAETAMAYATVREDFTEVSAEVGEQRARSAGREPYVEPGHVHSERSRRPNVDIRMPYEKGGPGDAT